MEAFALGILFGAGLILAVQEFSLWLVGRRETRLLLAQEKELEIARQQQREKYEEEYDRTHWISAGRRSQYTEEGTRWW